MRSVACVAARHAAFDADLDAGEISIETQLVQIGWNVQESTPNVTALFQRLAFDAGLPPIREHDLRHGAASLARKAGADMKAIQAMLRHSSLAITADTYTSLFADEGHAVAEAMTNVVPRKAVAGGASETPGPSSIPGRKPKGFRPAT